MATGGRARRPARARPSRASRSACPSPRSGRSSAALDRAARHGAPLAATLAAPGARRPLRARPADPRGRRAGRARRSSSWWRCCWCRPSCCSWPRRWPRRCSTAARGMPSSSAVRAEPPARLQAAPPNRRSARKLAFRSATCTRKRASWRAVVPPLTTAVFRSAEPKTGRRRDTMQRPSDGKVGNGVAEWEKVGYGGISQSTGVAGLLPLRHSGLNSSLGDMTVGISWPLRALAGREEPAQHSGPVPRGLLQWNRSRQGPGTLRRGLDRRRARGDHRARARRAEPDQRGLPAASRASTRATPSTSSWTRAGA